LIRSERNTACGRDGRTLWSMIPKSMPSGFDPMGGNRFSVKIMLKTNIETTMQFDRIAVECNTSARRG
jgi:hypothetical protein